MRFIVQFAAVLAAGMLSITPVCAQYGGVFAPLDPGFWGAGYWGARPYYSPAWPAYSGSYASYSPVWSGYAPSPTYTVGYAPEFGGYDQCCSPCAVSACGNGCGTNCPGGDCQATGTATDTLKPAEDPNFRSRNPSDSNTRDPEREFGKERDDDGLLPPRDRYERETPPLDGFDTPADRLPARNPGAADDSTWSPTAPRGTPGTDEPARGPGAAPAGGNEDGLFPEDNFGTLRNTNKPPMSDPLDTNGLETVPSSDPVDPKSEVPEKTNGPLDDFLPATPTSMTPASGSPVMLSRLRDVIPAARLARRSLPAARAEQAMVQAPAVNSQVRWISAPSIDGSVRR